MTDSNRNLKSHIYFPTFIYFEKFLQNHKNTKKIDCKGTLTFSVLNKRSHPCLLDEKGEDFRVSCKYPAAKLKSCFFNTYIKKAYGTSHTKTM